MAPRLTVITLNAVPRKRPWGSLASLCAALALEIFAAHNAEAQTLDDSFEGGDRGAFEAFLEGADSVFDDGERRTFSQGMLDLVLRRYAPTRDLDPFSRLALLDAAFGRAGETMTGLSYREIFEYGELLTKGQQSFDADSESAASSQVDAESALHECMIKRVQIALVDIEEPQQNDIYSRFSLSVENNLGIAIKGVKVKFTWSTEGRSIPWTETEERIFFSGGIEPGETLQETGRVHLHRLDERPEPFVFAIEAIDLFDADNGSFMRQDGWGQCR